MSRLNEIDSNILQTGQNIDFNSTQYSYLDGEFGQNPNDYVEALIHDEEENFLESGIVDKDDYTINPIGVKLKTGTILRKYGYDRGRYVVKYNFFRKLAGSYENLLVNENQESYIGDINVDDQTGKITGTDNQELFIKENKYLIHEISPSRTELRITTQNIRDRQYISDFFNLQRGKKIISSTLGDEFIRNPVFFTGADAEEKIDSTTIELPIPTTTNMVGGFIYLNDVYNTKVVESEKTAEDLIDEFYDEQANYEYGGS
jgi:hypothetical protein